jgi:hypothetical protein
MPVQEPVFGWLGRVILLEVKASPEVAVEVLIKTELVTALESFRAGLVERFENFAGWEEFVVELPLLAEHDVVESDVAQKKLETLEAHCGSKHRAVVASPQLLIIFMQISVQ